MKEALIIFIGLFSLTIGILILVVKSKIADKKEHMEYIKTVQADRNRIEELLEDIEELQRSHDKKGRKIDASKNGDLANMFNNFNN